MDEELRDQDSAGSGNSAQAAHASRHPRRTEHRDRETRSGRARGLPWLGRFMGWDDSEGQRPRDEAMIRELQSQVRSAGSRIRRLQNEAQEAHDQAQEARSQVQQVWSQLCAEQDANRRLRQTAQSIQSERDSMSVNIKKQEAQIRQVQALAFEGIGGDSWAAGDDGTVRADLENLHTRMKSWAKKYSVEDMSEVLKGLGPDEHISFIQLLVPVVRLRAGTQNSMEHLASTSMKKKSPAMCLQGLLAYHVYAKIIGRPFFAHGDAAETLHNVYMLIQQVNESESHLWRSKTLRLLSAPPSNAQPGDGRPSYSTAQKTVCRNLAIDFYTSPAHHLIKSPTQPGGDAQEQGNAWFTDLEAIIQHAGELSSRLWSRRTALRVKLLAELKDERFVARSELMKAHPLHRLYEDDDKCDGWLAGVVTHPAVLGFGSGDGRDYTTPRVWMKAEVWLAKDIFEE